MTPNTRFAQATTEPVTFWQRLLSSADLRECDDLEKILVGCEIIAALDGTELLAA